MKNVNKTILVGILSITMFGGCAKDIQSAMNNIKNENYSGLVGDVMNIGSSSMENGTIQKLLEKGSNTDGSKIDPKNGLFAVKNSIFVEIRSVGNARQ